MGAEFVPKAAQPQKRPAAGAEIAVPGAHGTASSRSRPAGGGPVDLGLPETGALPGLSGGATRIRRAVGSSDQAATAAPGGERVIRREIGTVPAPYRPLQKGETATPAVPRPAPQLGPSTSLEDFAANAAKDYKRYVDNDDVMLDLLLGPFEANWFKAKACLTMGQWPPQCGTNVPPHEVGVKLMHALVRMRKAKWTEFVTTVVKPQFRERMAMFGAIQGPLTDLPKMPPARAKGDASPPTDRPLGRHSVANPAALGVDLQSDLDLQAKKDADAKTGKNLQEIFDSVGAEAVTSDVDLASGGSNSELGVQFVNSRFRTHFKPGRVIPYDPGTVFDINLYASDWIHGETETGRTAVDGGQKVTLTPGAEVPEMTGADTATRDRRMEVWSLVKVRRNLSDEEWQTYTGTITRSLQGPELVAMQGKLDEADREYRKFEANVTQRQQAMMASIQAQEQAFFHRRPSAFGAANAGFAGDAHTTRASNAIYEETLQTVKELRLRIKTLQAAPVKNDALISSLGVQLADKIAEALTYANEVYATEGAVQHTVLKQGSAKKAEKLNVKEVDYALRPELYLQSVNENVGDALHSLHHFEDVPPYAVYRAGKYLARLCDAASLLLGSGAPALPNFARIKEIADKSVQLKKKKTNLRDVRGRTFGIPESRAHGVSKLQEKEPDRIYDVEGDPDFVRADGFFGGFDPSQATAMRALIIEFGAAVPKALSDKRADEERAARAAKETREQVASTS